MPLKDDRGFDVLLLDGETRAALAVVRSLGELGLRIGVVSSDGFSPALASRYTTAFRKLPSPRHNGQGYLSALESTVSELNPRLLLPVSDLSWNLLLTSRIDSPLRSLLPKINTESLQTAFDKSAVLRTAESLGIHVPKTAVLLGGSDLSMEICRDFLYPAVIKPESSEQQIDGTYKKPAPRYLTSAEEAEIVLKLPEFAGVRCLLQEKISGSGVGVFALCTAGESLAVFCHQRLLEKPPSGGPSVLSESIAESAAPVSESLALLKALRWEGVAMVEYKRSADGRFFLMEINPRFWGSLQLAIDCGRDFPALYYRLLRGESAETLRKSLFPYAVGKRLRWDLGTLDHAVIRLKKDGLEALGSFCFKNSLHLFSCLSSTRHETFRFKDPIPFVYEVISYARDCLRERIR